jgi:tRNA pseudouridine synthase 10
MRQDLPGICRRCLGRAFAMIGSGTTNIERGNIALTKFENKNQNFEIVEESNCSICSGIFLRLMDYCEQLSLMSKDYEFNSFLIGSRFPEEILKLEEQIQQSIEGSNGESIRKEFNRELGKAFESYSPKSTNFNSPEITFIIDTNFDSIKLQVKSLFIYGTYRKLIRNIPQTRWIKYSEITDSVESIIGNVICPMSSGHEFFLHGAGREDIDVRMLGNGREFVIEITDPHKRTIDLKYAEETINNLGKGVEVHDLSFADKQKVVEVKSERNNKTYVARIRNGDSIFDRKLLERSLESVTGKAIYQRTPLRVAESRSDAIRDRRILEAVLLYVNGSEATVEITAEAGTYIKEFINGDEGRTKGSLSEVYGNNLDVLELDVIKIHRGA